MSLATDSKPINPTMQLVWLLGIRFAVIGFSLVASLATIALLDGSSVLLAKRMLWPLVGFLAASLGSWWWVKRYAYSPRFVVTQLSIDVLLVTSIVYGTGGAISPFLFLYLPVVMVAAVLGSRLTALMTAAASGACYLGLTIALKVAWLVPLDGSVGVETPSSGLALQLTGLCSAMVLVAIATSYLMQTISKRDAQVAQSQKDLHQVSEQQAHLIESLPESMCVVDPSGHIRTWNKALSELFHVSDRTLRGADLLTALQNIATHSTVLREDSGYSGELSLLFNDESEERNIRCASRPLPEQGGYVVMFQDISELRSVEEQLELQDRMARLLSATSEPSAPSPRKLGEFVGESVVMQKVFSLITRVAKSDATILVHGESGTGKELVARAVHQESSRFNQPFIAVNCGAIPETLLESEFFGHKKGSFTGAHADHPGLFQRASGGTLFLDEIGELPTLMQAKLLRALQEKSIRPVGGERDYTVDVRIIAATNRNLKKEIENGNFREDLYYRLNVISINLPALRERKEDIPLLVSSIMKRLMSQRRVGSEPGASLIGSAPATLPPQTLQLLVNYTYPGNVRELENILERAFVLGGAVVLPEHLPEALRADSTTSQTSSSSNPETTIIIDESVEFPVDLERILESLERRYIESALERSGGVKKKAAKLLGINFRSLRYRLQKFGLHDDADSEAP